MQSRPLEDQASRTLWKKPFQDLDRVNAYTNAVLIVNHVKVWRHMIIIKHSDHYTVKFTYSWHISPSADSKSLQAGFGGDGGTRTLDPLNAIEVLSQLSYIPTYANYSKGGLTVQGSRPTATTGVA